jgi:hypothetical protein
MNTDKVERREGQKMLHRCHGEKAEKDKSETATVPTSWQAGAQPFEPVPRGGTGSQDELRCSAIHKQRPYRVRSRAGALGICQAGFGELDEGFGLGGSWEGALGKMFGAAALATEFF